MIILKINYNFLSDKRTHKLGNNCHELIGGRDTAAAANGKSKSLTTPATGVKTNIKSFQILIT